MGNFDCVRTNQRKRFRVADVFIIAFLIALSAMFLVVQFSDNGSGMTMVVRKDSEEIMKVNLSQVNEPYEVCIDSEYNIILSIDRNRAEVISSECPDKVCVSAGVLDRVGMSAVCLPAKISVEIIGGENQLDGVVG
ncbi:MAG: NusG domain II-containing protein [Lachnospiraceae bacterium]|nr:NusG domain II-containing protein [Lachnospiraceae bacterium]